MALPSYAPRLRTALVLCGAGTAGAYQAGVLRALVEAGVKIDVVAAHGAGVITALSAAVDSGAPLWSPTGPWTSARLRHAYRWRAGLRFGARGVVAACLFLLSPLLVLVLATLVYGASLVAGLANFTAIAARLVGVYQWMLTFLFQPHVLPTIVPRAVALAMLVVLVVLVSAAVRAWRGERSRRRRRGAIWWRLVGHPLDPREPEGVILDALWGLARGASNAPAPARDDIGRRYVEMLTENFGQPGFREVLVAVHDVDARLDVVASALGPDWRAAFGLRRVGAGTREAEVVDLAAGNDAERALVADFLLGGLRLPGASAAHDVTLPVQGFWRGETHRWCDRPELAVRLIDEIAHVGIEQVILVGAAPPPATPHGMRARSLEFRGRLGEVLRSVETAAFQDAWSAAASRFSGVFAIRPDHNPIGPFDFEGAYDESSDRQRTISELTQQGHDDAYRQFIEPVVATGERITEI